jgi:RHS repeat-associated protein
MYSKIYHQAQPSAGGTATESYTYRMDGQIFTRTRQNGGTTTYTYTPIGQLWTVVTPLVPSVTYNYDQITGRVQNRVDAAGLHTYNYSPTTGLPTGESIDEGVGSMNLLAGAIISYDYDSQLRRKSLNAYFAGEAIPTATYQYSEQGRLSRVSSNGVQVNYAYIPKSTLVEHRDYKVGGGTLPLLTAAHHYDNRGNLVDVINTRPSVTSAGKISHHYTVDELNRRTRAEREDDSQWDYSYDTRSQVTSGKKSIPAGLLPGAQMKYTYDNIGNRITSEEGGNTAGLNLRTTTYTTNDLNQYSSISRPTRKADFLGTAATNDAITLFRPGLSPLPAERQGPWWRLEVDAPDTISPFAWADIRKNGVNIDGSTTPRRAPVYPTGVTGVTAAYDANGNQTYDGRNYYLWDTEGRLTSAGPPTGVYPNYFFDAEGRRICKHVDIMGPGSILVALYTDFYLYDGWNLIATYRIDHTTGAAPIPRLKQSYVWGLDVSGTYQGAGGVGGLLSLTEWGHEMQTNSYDSNVTEVTTSSTFLPAYDGNGNVMALVDTVGDISATYEYDPFGRPLRATGPTAQINPFRFSTKFTDDETGLVYYGYRYYDAAQGRWLGRDPIGERGGPNLFGMCWNNPMLFIDDTGLEATIAPPRSGSPKLWPPGATPRPGTGITPGKPRPRPGTGRPGPGGGGSAIEIIKVIKIITEDPLDPMNIPLLELIGLPTEGTPAEPVEPEPSDSEEDVEIETKPKEVYRESNKEGCCLIWCAQQLGGDSYHNDFAARISLEMNKSMGGPLGANTRYEVFVAPPAKSNLMPARFDGGSPYPHAHSVFEAKTRHFWLYGPQDLTKPHWKFGLQKLLDQTDKQKQVADKCNLSFFVAFSNTWAAQGWRKSYGETRGRVIDGSTYGFKY